jgi:hypothetical protein
VLAKQNVRDARGQTPKVLSLRIYKYPVALNFSGFRIVRLLLHFRLSVSLFSFQ